MGEEQPFAPPIARALWRSDTASLAPWQARLLRVLRVVYGVVRDVVDGRLTLHATSLVYTTLLSLVPMLAISFSVLKGLGVHNQLEPLLRRALAPLGSSANEVTENIIGFVDKMQVGVLGTLGIGLLVYTAISMIQKVEQAFNETWRISSSRPLARKFADYLSVLLIGPVLMFSALGITASVQSNAIVQRLSEIEPLGLLLQGAGSLTPHLLMLGAITFAYSFIPNTRVRLWSAFAGAVIAVVLWTAAGRLFAIFVSGSASYTAIYSAFAAIVIFIIWLYVDWLILLIGATIAFYLQHPEYLTSSLANPEICIRTRERCALLLAAEIAEAFYSRRPGPTLTEMTKTLCLPQGMLDTLIRHLVAARLITPSADEPPRYLPAQPPEETPVKSVLDAVRAPPEERHGEVRPDVSGCAAAPVIDDIEQRIDRATVEALRSVTVKDLIAQRHESVPSELKRFAATAARTGASAGSKP
jgi:membrane protein